MKKLCLTLVIFFSVTLCISHTFAQYETSMQIGVPDGAIARFSRGVIRNIEYSPDGSQVAVTTSIGVWLHDAQTGKELELKKRYSNSNALFSPDHKRYVTYEYPIRWVQLWDSRNSKHIITLTGHKEKINTVKFSLDSNTIATTSDDKTIRLWDARTGKYLKTLTGHTEPVYAVEFSPDGETIASGSADKTIRLWNMHTGKLIKTFTEAQTPIEFSPDGKVLLGRSGSPRQIQMLNVMTGELIKTLHWSSLVRSVVFSADSNIIAAGDYDGMIRLWDATTGQTIKTFKAHTDTVVDVVFSPDGKTLATAGRDDTMRWWDIQTAENIKTFSEYLGGYSGMKYSPDGKTIAIERHDKVWLRDASTGKHLITFEGHTEYIAGSAFSPKKNIIATGSADKTARLWNADTGESIRTLTGHTHTVYTPVFSPDGNKLATHCRDNTLRLWDINTGKNIITHERERQGMNFTFSPDSQILAIGSDAGAVSLLNTDTGEKIRTLLGHSSYVHPPLFSSNGNTMVTYSKDRSVRLWNVHTGENINTLNIMGTVNSVLHAPDGEMIAITSHKETVSMWNVETGQLLKEFEGHKKRGFDVLGRFSLGKKQKRRFGAPLEHIRIARFSPNGKSVATVRNNKSVQMWDISTGKRIGKLIKPPQDDPSDDFTVTDIEYAPDGNTLATFQLGNLGGTVRLYDTSTGKHLKTLKGYTYCGNSLKFSPDSKTIATGHWDGTVLIWDIPHR